MSITLRGAYTTEDRRLDRLPEFDERNKDHPISAVVPADLQSRVWRLVQRLDQGQEGQCVMYAWHHEACAMPVPRKTPTKDLITNRYYRAQQIDPWPGGEYPNASPVYGGTSVLAGAKVMRDAGYFKEFRWAFTLYDVLRALSHEGPVVFGVDWYEDMFHPDSRGLIRVGGKVVGGHSICARGLDLKRREIILRQSWGKSHGVNGDVRLGFNDIEKLLADGGDACVPVNRM